METSRTTTALQDGAPANRGIPDRLKSGTRENMDYQDVKKDCIEPGDGNGSNDAADGDFRRMRLRFPHPRTISCPDRELCGGFDAISKSA